MDHSCLFLESESDRGLLTASGESAVEGGLSWRQLLRGERIQCDDESLNVPVDSGGLLLVHEDRNHHC